MNSSVSPMLSYVVSMPHPHTHYFEVELYLENFDPSIDFLDFKMAVWTPGSYLVREYAKNVENLKAFGAENQPIKAYKLNKNTWRVYPENYTHLKLTYRVYAFELTVRTCFLDSQHGYINGAALFLYRADMLQISSTILINPPKTWEKITTSLPPIVGEKNKYWAEDFDTLVDSPIEIGNQDVFSFEAENIPHTVAFFGLKTYKKKQITEDFKKIIQSATAIFGENPCKHYTIISHFTPKGRGGLEHKNSTSLLAPTNTMDNKENYQDFLTLTAHEYFHLWNVKRLRPTPLGPFDYEKENYTTMLWQAEGFTTYYEKIIMLKAHFIKPEGFVTEQAKRIELIENQVGIFVQSLTESSIDAWIKYYRPNENSPNSTISYYIKGSIIALLLDLKIIANSKARYNLDDVMKALYQAFYKEKDRGFTEQELKKTLESFTDENLDTFFSQYIEGTDSIDYFPYFKALGVHFSQTSTLSKISLGMQMNESNLITFVKKDSTAYHIGLNVGDELIALNGKTVRKLSEWEQKQPKGQKVEILVSRNGELLSFETLTEIMQEKKVRLIPIKQKTSEQNQNYQKWLRMI